MATSEIPTILSGETEHLESFCNDCECVCCDCVLSSALYAKCNDRTQFHMNPFTSYVACIYPPKRAASVVPTVKTNNNLNPGYCDGKRNCNFPGSSADLCSQTIVETDNAGEFDGVSGTKTIKYCSRLGIRMYKAGVPETKCNNPLLPAVPESDFGMMNSMPPACMKQCGINKGSHCGEKKCCTLII